MTNTNLFTPLTIRGITFKNRIAVSPMCQYSSQDGFANEWHLVHLGSRAVGGAGLIITEATAVTPEGRISPQDLGLWKDEHIDYLKRINDFILAHHSIPGVQLAHAGRKASTKRPWPSEMHEDWQPIAPSNIPFSETSLLPHEMSSQDITDVVQAFVNASKRAKKAGFQFVEIHAAHGYLLHEFFSPLSNKRKDNYGGSFDNRIRLLVEVSSAVRQEWPDELPLFVRLSCTDWVKNGWDIEETIALSKRLKECGVDVIDASSGGNIPQAIIPHGPGYQTSFAERIRKEANIASGAIGMIISPAQADHIIRTEQADIVLLGREFLRNPYWPLYAAAELGYETAWPPQYARAKTH